MPRRVQPYGSAVDAESAGLARSRPGYAAEDGRELGSTMTARDVARQAAQAVQELNDLTSAGADVANLDDAREVIASLQRMTRDLPRLCEQLARILVVQREDRQVAAGPARIPTSGWARRSRPSPRPGRPRTCWRPRWPRPGRPRPSCGPAQPASNAARLTRTWACGPGCA